MTTSTENQNQQAPSQTSNTDANPTSTSVPPSTPVNTPDTKLKHRTLKWVILPIGTIVLILLIVGVWWWWQHAKNTTQPKIHPKVEVNTPTQTFSDLSIKETQSYTSQNCRYRINYPKDWYIYTEAGQEDLSAILITSSQIQSNTPETNEIRVQIGCHEINNSLALRAIVDALNARHHEQNATIDQNQLITIGGKTAFEQNVATPTGSIREYYIFPATDLIVIVNIYPSDSSLIDTAKSTINEMTFL